jgi:hypothetical protein
MRNGHTRLLMILLTSSALTGCGTMVPDIKEAWDTDIPATATTMPVPGAGQIEFEIKKQIYCELRGAVNAANQYHQKTDDAGALLQTLLPKDWGALVSLSLTVDESSALNPGATFTDPMASAISTFGVVNKVPVTTSTPRLFSLGAGGTLSSTATRTDKFDPYYTIQELSRPLDNRDPYYDVSMCNPSKPENDPLVAKGHSPAKSSLLISSQLGLTQWLLGALFTNDAIPSVVGPSTAARETLADERNLLRSKGFLDTDITKIIVSGASFKDVTGLESKGYARIDIVNYLDQGATPAQLGQLKDQGYEHSEIAAIMSKLKAPASKQQGGAGGGGGTTPDTISIEIKFVIVSSGNVTPTWKLLRVSASSGSAPLFGMGRTRTHDLIITIGPNNTATANTHLASQIGNSVSTSNQAVLGTSPSNFTPLSFFGF